jgi:hypothetical protein
MAKRNKASLNMAPPFKITKITVLAGSGTDQIRIETSLPLGVWPYEGHPQTLRMEVSRGMGEDYVREHFGIEPEVIQV